MGTRIRISSDRVFDALFIIQHSLNLENISYENPSNIRIVRKYPSTFTDEEIIKSVPQFSYPYPCQMSTVLHFSFVLTSIDSKWTFGYCRHAPKPSTEYIVLLSSLPWHETFYKLLNFIFSISYDEVHLNQFLDSLYNVQIPEPGLQLHVDYYVNSKKYEFTAQCPDHHKIPSIPEDRNLTELFNALDTYNMIVIFASLLNERRILITSSKLSRLSACVQASNSLIYPMHWQHIFIPILPISLLDYLSAPMPFLIGVPATNMKRVKYSELGDIVLVDADENKVETPFNDIESLPNEILNFLRKNLRSSNNLLGDVVARTFLKGLVQLIGGYHDALHFNEVIKFDEEKFILSRSASFQPFLRKMLHLQIFQQFIENRLQMLTDESFIDEFEVELNMYEGKASTRFKSQYREWLLTMRKESGAILKSMNPAVKFAYKQVKDKSKQAYKDIKTKLHDNIKSDHHHHHHQHNENYLKNQHRIVFPTGNGYELAKPRSAPSSPVDTISISSTNSNSKERSLFNFNKRKEGIKKSISGVALALSERNMLNGKSNTSSSSKLDCNGSSNSLKTVYQDAKFNSSLISPAGTGKKDKQAPQASSEDSEIDSENDDELNYQPINLDLMSDLEEILMKQQQQSFSNNFNTSLDKSTIDSLMTKTNQTSTISLKTPLTAPPRALKRRTQNINDNKQLTTQLSMSSQSSLSSLSSLPTNTSTPVNTATKSNNLLIQLESSPEEDVTTLFDPLLKLNNTNNEMKTINQLQSNHSKSSNAIATEHFLLDFKSLPPSSSSSPLISVPIETNRSNEIRNSKLDNSKRYGVSNESALYHRNHHQMMMLMNENLNISNNPFQLYHTNLIVNNGNNNNSSNDKSNGNENDRNWQKFD